MSLVTTVGGESSDSYATLTEATTYLQNRVGFEDWADGNYSDEQKEAALIDAARMLDEFTYLGNPVTYTQALQFPRVFVLKRNGNYYLSTEIPQEIKDAQCILAFQLLTQPESFGADDLSQYSSIGIGMGELTVAMRPGYGSTNNLPSQVTRRLAHLIGSSQAPLLRG